MFETNQVDNFIDATGNAFRYDPEFAPGGDVTMQQPSLEDAKAEAMKGSMQNGIGPTQTNYGEIANKDTNTPAMDNTPQTANAEMREDVSAENGGVDYSWVTEDTSSDFNSFLLGQQIENDDDENKYDFIVEDLPTPTTLDTKEDTSTIFESFEPKKETKTEDKTEVDMSEFQLGQNTSENAQSVYDNAVSELEDYLLSHGMEHLDYEQILDNKDAVAEPYKVSDNDSKELYDTLEEIFSDDFDYVSGREIDFVFSDSDKYNDYTFMLEKGKRVLGIGTKDKLIVSDSAGNYILEVDYIKPSASTNGIYEVYEVSNKEMKDGSIEINKGKRIAGSPSGGTTSDFKSNVTKALQNAIEKDWETKNTSKYPQELIKLAEKARDAKNFLDADNEAKKKLVDIPEVTEIVPGEADEALEKEPETPKEVETSKEEPIDVEKEIEKWKESNPEYKDFEWDKYSKKQFDEADYDEAKYEQYLKDLPELTQKFEETINDKSIGQEEKDTAAIELIEAKDYIINYEYMYDANHFDFETQMQKIYNKIGDAASLEQFEAAAADLNRITIIEANKVSNELVEIVEDMAVMLGDIDWNDIKSNEDFVNKSTELFKMGQSIYAAASELETKMKQAGFDDTMLEEVRKGKDEALSYLNELAETNDIFKCYSQLLSQEIDNNDLAKYITSPLLAKDASAALMKSAAFNGAIYSEYSGKYSENNSVADWENSLVYDPNDALTWKDVVALVFSGLGAVGGISAGTTLCILGQPQIGIPMLLGSATSTAEDIGKYVNKKQLEGVTNKDVLTGSDDKKKQNAINYYRQMIDRANTGDPKALSTYVLGLQAPSNAVQGVIDSLTRLDKNNVLAASAIAVAELYKGNTANAAAIMKEFARNNFEDVIALKEGGLDNTVANVYRQVKSVVDSTNKLYGTEIELPEFPEQVFKRELDENNFAGTSSYGVTLEDNAEPDSKYSGYREQAINSNLSEDYNRGMSEEANEAVSDESVKKYVVRIYNSEPGYIRNALDKVLVALKHSSIY